MKLISGIYKIEDVKTGAVYVGSADSANGIKKRWSNHATLLKNNSHRYKELQDAYNDDTNRIKWEILEECGDDELEELENYYIDYCNKVDGWTVINKQKNTKRKCKVKDTSKMKKAQQGENNGHNTKLSEDDVIEIRQMIKNGIKQYVIAEKYDISKTLVSNIKNKHRWSCI